jgi:hypothetical protein
MESVVNFVFWFFVIWFATAFLRAALALGSSPIHQQQVTLEATVLPLKLEYTKDQWFAWDSDDEFLGQASSKEQLFDYIATRFDYPKEQFQIISEVPMENTTK